MSKHIIENTISSVSAASELDIDTKYDYTSVVLH